MVIREDDAVQIVSELHDVNRAAEMSLTHGATRGRRERLQPVALQLDQSIAGRPRAIVQIHRGLDEHATTRPLLPFEPPIEQRLQSRQASIGEQRGSDHRGHEALRGTVEHLDLQRFLRAEVREETTLRELEIVSEPPDRQAFEPHPAGEIDRVVHDGVTGFLAFSHRRQS